MLWNYYCLRFFKSSYRLYSCLLLISLWKQWLANCKATFAGGSRDGVITCQPGDSEEKVTNEQYYVCPVRWHVWYILFLDPKELAILGNNPVFTLKAWRYCYCLSFAAWPQEKGSIQRQYFCLPSLDEEAELTLPGLCVLSLLCRHCSRSFPQHSVSENHSWCAVVPHYICFLYSYYRLGLPPPPARL